MERSKVTEGMRVGVTPVSRRRGRRRPSWEGTVRAIERGSGPGTRVHVDTGEETLVVPLWRLVRPSSA